MTQTNPKHSSVDDELAHIEDLLVIYGNNPTGANRRRIMALIEAERVKAELAAWKEVRKSYPKKQTIQGNAVSKLTLADIDRKITQLTNTTEGERG